MSSIQERLQLKRVPLDTWNIREQLCLASAVVRSGDQNWMSVSRALKTVGEPNRPPDWYSQKSCAAQYGVLLEHVETPKRKKRSSEGAVETPQESILKKLTQERIVEIQKTLAEMNQQYDQLKMEVLEAHNSSTSEDRLREMWSSIESRARAREREAARRAAWLKERDERRARSDRAWRPAQAAAPNNTAGSPAPPASPLLTSLLKSSPVVTTPQHISHPANVVDTMSPSVTAPTLSMLLEKCAAGAGAAPQLESKHAAIEHIKSQLVQIEHQLKASNPAPLPPPASPPAAAPPLDIDDIEIKAEDVYAFRDVDIHIPPVTAMHKPNTRVLEKAIKKEDAELTPAVSDAENANVDEQIIKEEPETVTTENIEEEVLVEDIEAPPEVQIEEPEPVREATPEAEVKITFPEVKFPTTEIKVIQPEDHKIKEEIKEVEVAAPAVPEEPEVLAPEPEPVETVVQEISEPIPLPVEESKPEELPEEPTIENIEEIVPETIEPLDPATIPLPPDAETDSKEVEEQVIQPPPLPVEAPPEEEAEQTIEQRLEMMEKGTVEEQVREPIVESAPDTRQLRPEVDEDSIPLKEMMKEECGLQGAEPEAKPDAAEGEDPHTETDDDTPMELSREEEKDGKKKRDYSRKKKSESRTWSGSESAEASAPESPLASDAERQHRLWKKSVMLVYSRLCAHKYASLFLRPISDDEAPGYSLVVKRPMDMTTIRRNIDSGHIRTTAQFQREILLMLSNALMYNSSEHSVYTMAQELHKEAQCQLGMLVAAQAHAGLVEGLPEPEAPPAPPAPPATRKRRRHDDPPHHQPPPDKRHH